MAWYIYYSSSYAVVTWYVCGCGRIVLHHAFASRKLGSDGGRWTISNSRLLDFSDHNLIKFAYMNRFIVVRFNQHDLLDYN